MENKILYILLFFFISIMIFITNTLMNINNNITMINMKMDELLNNWIIIEIWEQKEY